MVLIHWGAKRGAGVYVPPDVRWQAATFTSTVRLKQVRRVHPPLAVEHCRPTLRELTHWPCGKFSAVCVSGRGGSMQGFLGVLLLLGHN